MTNIPIAVAEGDGIGPEIMAATLAILQAAKVPLEIHKVEIGEAVYLRGEKTGITSKTWQTILNTKAFLKAPITTPQGGGFKSLNVTVRTTLGLFANVRPCIAYSPFVQTKHPQMDIVVIRENEEDLYVGIEYQQTPETVHALKVLSRSGSEKIIRYAFEYARANGRKKVTCFTKDNILKLSDGLFHKVFEEVAENYPDIEKEHWIVDIGAAKLADTPQVFDVVVLPNLYGDILSDVTAQICGSVGLVGSANIGKRGAMFEAIHGSAPRRAGQNLANPSGLLNASVMMLAHLGLTEYASLIQNAWLKTIEDGIHTYDIFTEGVSKEKVGTKEFGKAVIQRLSQTPNHLKQPSYSNLESIDKNLTEEPKHKQKRREIVGVDVFVEFFNELKDLVKKIESLNFKELKLTSIGNRGVIVWPNKLLTPHCIDNWRLRFAKEEEKPITREQIVSLMQELAEGNIAFVHLELLLTFDGQPGYMPT